jgi:ketosteroid isomerase-like protein
VTDEERIAIAKKFNETFSATPFTELRAALLASEDIRDLEETLGSDGVVGFVFEYIDPEIRVDVEFPGAGTLTGDPGVEGFFQFWRDWLEPWERLEAFASNYTVDGDRVLADQRLEAEGGLSGAEVELDLCQVITIRKGKMVSYAIYPDRAKALAADYSGA